MIIEIVFILLHFLISENKIHESSTWERYRNNLNLIFDKREELSRQRIFYNNLKRIKFHNRYNSDYKMGITSFMHITPQEIKLSNPSVLMENQLPTNHSYVYTPKNIKLPKEVDWRVKNVVTRVKSQGSCGACYVFGATASLESAYAIKTGKLLTFSEQQIIDCETHKFGCHGGTLLSCFMYWINNGFMEDKVYPYKAKVQKCKHKNNLAHKGLKSYTFAKQSESVLQQAIALNGPVSVSFYFKGHRFLFFFTGVYYDKNCRKKGKSSHSFVIVGYGTTKSGKEYYIFKNSWGKLWGTWGFGLIGRNMPDSCGLLETPMFPVF